MRVGNHYGSLYAQNTDCYIKRVTWLDGYGLFVRRAYKTGEILTDYAGMLIDVNADDIEDVRVTTHYRTMMRIGRSLRVIDGFREPVDGYGLAQFANHGVRNNCKFKVFDTSTTKHPHLGIVLVATRPIYPEEEIIINYGKHFFERLEIHPVEDAVRIVQDLYATLHEPYNLPRLLSQTIPSRSIVFARAYTKKDIIHVLALCILKNCTAYIVPKTEEMLQILNTALSTIHDPLASNVLARVQHFEPPRYDLLLEPTIHTPWGEGTILAKKDYELRFPDGIWMVPVEDRL
jgi:hypothetical protein